MLVYIEDIQQNMSLSTGYVKSFARLKLPTGVIINIPLEEVQIKAILEASTGAANSAPQPEQPPTSEEYPPLEQPDPQYEQSYGEEAGNEDDLVSWEDLPDTVLSDAMKDILREVGAAPEMPMGNLVTLVDDISERMMQQAEARSQEPPRAAPPQVAPQNADWPAKPANVPPPGKVEHPVGRVIVPRTPPIRSVQKDEMGYPVVPGMVNDPGEIPAFGDEDGVPGI